MKCNDDSLIKFQALFTLLVAFQLLLLRQIKAESESEADSAVIGELGFSSRNPTPTQGSFRLSSGSNPGSPFGSLLSQQNNFQLTNNQPQAFHNLQNPQVRFPVDNQRFRNPVFSQPIFPTQSSIRNTNEKLIKSSFQNSGQNPRGQLSRAEVLRYSRLMSS